MKLRNKIAGKIRQIRTDMGLTQAELAARCRLPVTNINRIEKSPQNLTIDKLELLAKGLGISIAELFRDEEPVQLSPSDEFELRLRQLRDVKKRLVERR